MADVRISELPGAAPLTGDETIPCVQSTATKKATAKNIAKMGYQDILTDATAAKTLALTDIGAWIRTTAAITITIPLDSSVAFPVGTTINGVQAGTGQVTFSAAGGVTLNKPASYTAKTRESGSSWCLIKIATDAWDLIGDLEASA